MLKIFYNSKCLKISVLLSLNIFLGLDRGGIVMSFFKNGPFPASFSIFSSFQYTVDSKQMFNIHKFLPMIGFEPRTSGIRSNRSTNWATQPLPWGCYGCSSPSTKVLHGCRKRTSSTSWRWHLENVQWCEICYAPMHGLKHSTSLLLNKLIQIFWCKLIEDLKIRIKTTRRNRQLILPPHTAIDWS